MKFLIASDIHGSAKYCKLMLDAFEREKADKILLLGDILYHGPRNDLPEGHDPKKVVELLTAYRDKIICVRGNCDAEIDRDVLPFPMYSDYAYVYADGINIVMSHGHRDVPPMGEKDVYLTGHTHVPLNAYEGFYHLNPGSVALPKEGSAHAYIMYDDGVFTFKDMDGKPYDSVTVK
ncbi:MAG: phosphodiesterase [Clostridia bacterium]|nr:phosphodiesterase [Clostridia bacterium]